MLILSEFWWLNRIIISVFILILLFIMEILLIKYSAKDKINLNKNIFIEKNEQNPEKFLLENYKKIKSSGQYQNITLITYKLNNECEMICKIFAREKGIDYINLSKLK